MQIIDAQIHLWGSGLPSNQAHRQVTAFTAEEAIALMDEGGIDAAVIHPPPWDPDADEMAARAVACYPGRFAIMGSALPLDVRQAHEHVARWREQPGMLGLRYVCLKAPERLWLADGSLDRLWAEAERAGVPVALLATDSLRDIGVIAARFPGLRITIDHLGGRGGNTTLKDAAAMTHLPDLLALARHANLAVKATGLPGYAGEPWPYPAMQGFLRQVYDAFGPRRLFWGTDITKMPISWRQCAAMFTEELAWLSRDDLELIMGRAACDWWGWRRQITVQDAQDTGQ